MKRIHYKSRQCSLPGVRLWRFAGQLARVQPFGIAGPNWHQTRIKSDGSLVPKIKIRAVRPVADASRSPSGRQAFPLSQKDQPPWANHRTAVPFGMPTTWFQVWCNYRTNSKPACRFCLSDCYRWINGFFGMRRHFSVDLTPVRVYQYGYMTHNCNSDCRPCSR
jgi:hypothetical protein